MYKLVCHGDGSPIMLLALLARLMQMAAVSSATQRKPPCVVRDLFHDCRDGSLLLDLLEVTSGQRIVSPASYTYEPPLPTSRHFPLVV